MSVINDISVVFKHLRKLPHLLKLRIRPFNQMLKMENNTTYVKYNGILVDLLRLTQCQVRYEHTCN